jgi:serine protease Do
LPQQTVTVLLAVVVGVMSGFVGGLLSGGQQEITSQNIERQVISSESELINRIASEVGESVVSVNVVSQRQGADFFGFPQEVERQSAGTGIIVSKEGMVVTNRHVIPRGTTSVTLTMSDGTELEDVEVIGRTSENDPLDVAFLMIKDTKDKELKPAKLGDSAKVQVGERVVAIGNALGQFQNTVTTGIISGYGREIQARGERGNPETLINLFQTDASINQGNSGGPLVNMSGEVIGINTAVAGGGAENIGFAIPIDDVRPLIDSVLSKGKLERPFLGVRYVMITDDYAYTFNLPVERGAYIAPSQGGSSIVPDSPADRAGLQEKDIIVKIDGEELTERNSLISLIGRKAVGSTIELTVIRDGQEITLNTVLEAAPGE